jgi:glyoxylase-like metal-dependent hydrolase (beta-lactamase superfamily II)
LPASIVHARTAHGRVVGGAARAARRRALSVRRFLVGLVVLVILAAGGIWYLIGRLEVTKLTDHVHMFAGLGGNVGVLVTTEGVAVVDTMTFVRQGSAIRAKIRELTPQPIVVVLNTHYHRDHTHGNPAFAVGTKVVSTAKTLEHLRTRDADYWKERPAQDLLPNDTFASTVKEMRLGGKTIRAYHLGRGHTNGDMVVLFAEDRVLHTGDLFFNGHYPNIDLEAGGSVRLWPATLDAVLALPFDLVIPGHGPATSRASLERFREFLAVLWRETGAVRERGGSVDDAVRLVDLDRFGLSPLWIAPSLNRGFVVRRAWEEMTAPQENP